jgi:hypothetical protein
VVLKRGRGVLVLFGAGVVCTGACGPGLAPGTSGDQPLLTFGSQLASSDGVPNGANVRLGVIWTDPLQRQPDVPMPSDWFSTTLSPKRLDAFTTTFYRPPPPAALFPIDTPGGGDEIEMAFGEAFIFDDGDDDGAYQIHGADAEMAPPDRYLAGSPEAIVYVSRPFSRAQITFPLGPAILPGYTTLAFFCTGQVPGDIKQNFGMGFVLQPSQTLPEIRTCLRSHSP